MMQLQGRLAALDAQAVAQEAARLLVAKLDEYRNWVEVNFPNPLRRGPQDSVRATIGVPALSVSSRDGTVLVQVGPGKGNGAVVRSFVRREQGGPTDGCVFCVRPGDAVAFANGEINELPTDIEGVTLS